MFLFQNLSISPQFRNFLKRLKLAECLYHLAKLRHMTARTSTRLLEKIARSVEYNEPVLLVGETGTGKTTLVQNLAQWIGQKLTVLVCFSVHSSL
ncbi:unnamed protein product [Brassica oleracea var. botrytis]